MADFRTPPLVPEPPRGRRYPADRFGASRASILAGPDVKLVEVSPRELVVEADVRLAPGAGICLNVTLGEQTFLAGGRVAKVDAALVGGQVKYRAAVTLDTEIAAFEPHDAADAPAAERPPAVARPAATNADKGQPAAAVEPKADRPQPGSPQEQQNIQLLKTALRASEAARKELEIERVKWDEQRRVLEERAARAEKSAEETARQLNTSQQAERLLTTKHAKEQAAWTKDRAGLVESAKQAEARAEQLAKEAAAAKDSERSVAQKHAADKAAWSKEQTEWTRQQSEWEKAESEWEKAQAEWEKAQAEWEKDQAEWEKQQAASAREQAAWGKERQALQDGVKKADARVEQVSGELALARENEKRLTRKFEEQAAKLEERVKSLETTLHTKQREIEAARASLGAAEQKLVAHEQDRQSWASQKERLTDRLLLTEKWCADQQELLYQLRQQVGKAFALVDDWKPEANPADQDAEEPAEEKRGRSRKASA